jgi:hypothetical protein
VSKRPNVILFLADDRGYGDIGVHGNTVVKTPHIDAFARGCEMATDEVTVAELLQEAEYATG